VEIVKQHVETYQSLTLPWMETWVLPIGDVQCGVPASDVAKLRQHIEWGLEHNAYFLGMGDYVDMLNPSDRKRLAAANFNDTTSLAIYEKACRDLDVFRQAIAGTEGRWLGFFRGHHYNKFANGSTTDTLLAEEFGAPYLGDCAIITLELEDRVRGIRTEARIFGRHGSGSAVTEAAALTKLYKDQSAWDADIYLHAHHHRKVATKKPRLYVKDGKIEHRNQVLAVTGSFLRGYLQGNTDGAHASGTYVEQAGLAPVTLGGILLKLRPALTSSGVARLDVDVEL
jgi:hypothetical protein